MTPTRKQLAEHLTWTCPLSAAQCSGEQPSSSRQPTSVPVASSCCTSCSSPLLAAECRGCAAVSICGQSGAETSW